MANDIHEGFHIIVVWCFNALEFGLSTLLSDNAFQKEHVKVNIEIQCTTKSLNVSHRSCVCLLLKIPSPMHNIARNSTMNDLHDFT